MPGRGEVAGASLSVGSPPTRCSLAMDFACEVARRAAVRANGSYSLISGPRPSSKAPLITNSSVPDLARLMATYPASRVSESVASTKARS